MFHVKHQAGVNDPQRQAGSRLRQRRDPDIPSHAHSEASLTMFNGKTLAMRMYEHRALRRPTEMFHVKRAPWRIRAALAPLHGQCQVSWGRPSARVCAAPDAAGQSRLQLKDHRVAERTLPNPPALLSGQIGPPLVSDAVYVDHHRCSDGTGPWAIRAQVPNPLRAPGELPQFIWSTGFDRSSMWPSVQAHSTTSGHWNRTGSAIATVCLGVSRET